MSILGEIRDYIGVNMTARRIRKRAKQGKAYASGEFMASLPGMTEADKRFYRSKKYKGNRGIIKKNKRRKRRRKNNNLF